MKARQKRDLFIPNNKTFIKPNYCEMASTSDTEEHRFIVRAE